MKPIHYGVVLGDELSFSGPYPDETFDNFSHAVDFAVESNETLATIYQVDFDDQGEPVVDNSKGYVTIERHGQGLLEDEEE
jgi:hypothetical protein